MRLFDDGLHLMRRVVKLLLSHLVCDAQDAVRRTILYCRMRCCHVFCCHYYFFEEAAKFEMNDLGKSEPSPPLLHLQSLFIATLPSPSPIC